MLVVTVVLVVDNTLMGDKALVHPILILLTCKGNHFLLDIAVRKLCILCQSKCTSFCVSYEELISSNPSMYRSGERGNLTMKTALFTTLYLYVRHCLYFFLQPLVEQSVLQDDPYTLLIATPIGSRAKLSLESSMYHRWAR